MLHNIIGVRKPTCLGGWVVETGLNRTGGKEIGMALKHPIELLQMNKTKEAQFVGKGLTAVEDIAYFFPRRYIDFRNTTAVKDTVLGNNYALAGTIIDLKPGHGRNAATVQEDHETIPGYRAKFNVIWFGTDYYFKKLELGKHYVFCGRVSDFYGTRQIVAPLAFDQDPQKVCTILPIYPRIQGMSAQYLHNQIENAVGFLRANERAGEKELFANSLKLMPKFDAVREIHAPSTETRFKLAQQRIAYEVIYDFYSDLKQKDLYLVGVQAQSVQKDAATRQTIASLPFPLTADQQRTIDTIICEAKAGHRLHSLISGDVGCGKTMVAVLSSIFMWENGLQTILMAPTLVLAEQHYKEMQQYAVQLGMAVGLLTTETKKKERRQLLADFGDGSLDMLIGTHAVLNDEIVPHNLGMTIIDEEHKFGVKQKGKLEEYDKAGAHHISMTATPIPRSIAMAVYSDELAILPIRTMPAGRKPIQTSQCATPDEVFAKMYEEIQKGHQGYLICPFIEDSESDQFQNVMSISAAKELAEAYFRTTAKSVRIGVISGDMKQKDILDTVQHFADKAFDILISTTIVEVGVNVPNATVIGIMSADRFGLAALHQLRGRVGRSSDQGYCLLCSAVKTERLDILCQTTDGFVIAEEDMRLRGPGDLAGDAQSGNSEVINLIMQRPNLTNAIRKRIFA